mgnify:FL=1
MCSIVDVADYILEKYGTMTTMKLQKLAFYSQARALVVNGMPLFDEDFEAWANGPVSPALYALHKGRFLVHPGDLGCAGGKDDPLGPDTAAAVDGACGFLSTLSGNQLSQMTHAEDPWIHARKGRSDGDRCRTVIAKESMKDYYSLHPVWSTRGGL